MLRKLPFIQIPPETLAGIAAGREHVPTLYYSDFWAVRRFFWMRLRCVWRLLLRNRQADGSCLDFGGGGGVFLPTLASGFKEVVCADLEIKETAAVVAKYDLKNVNIMQVDLLNAEYGGRQFDAIVAADVLEHFQDLEPPVSAILRALATHGVLVTSLPTENWIYLLLRKVFGVTKPEDHYHTAAQVETFLRGQGLIPVDRLYVPCLVRIFPLFRVTAWRRVL